MVYHCFYTTICSVYYNFEFLEGPIGGVYIGAITLYIVPVNGYLKISAKHQLENFK
jgi:hypothetical protein